MRPHSVDEVYYAHLTPLAFLERSAYVYPDKPAIVYGDRKITYAQVVTLDVPDYAQHPEITYSVKYTRGPHEKREGILAPGDSVEVTEGMTFSVSPTGQS